MHREKQLLLSRWLFIEATQTHQFISYVDRHDLYIADELCFDLMLSNTLLFNLGLLFSTEIRKAHDKVVILQLLSVKRGESQRRSCMDSVYPSAIQ